MATKHPIIKHDIILQKYALLHDASEAYLLDVPKPLKRMEFFKDYLQAEDNLQSVIYKKFGLNPIVPDVVKQADIEILHLETKYLMEPLQSGWKEYMEGLPNSFKLETLELWPPEKAEAEFLNTYKKLFYEVPV